MSDKNTSKKSVRINVKKPVYCLLLSDTAEGTAYGDVKSLGAAMQVQLTPAIASGSLYGNGVQSENISKLTGIALALDVNKLNIEAKAEIMGNEYKDGVIIDKSGDEAPYIAVGYIVEGTNDADEYVWLLKGRATPMNESVQQQTNSINFSTDSVTINFIPRDYDKWIRFYGDTANSSFTKEQAEKWFEKGPDSYPKQEAGE